MTARPPGRGKLAANLERVPASEAKPKAAEPKKSGIEVIREDWQADADSKPEKRIRVVNHDTGRVVFTGSEADYRALRRSGD